MTRIASSLGSKLARSLRFVRSHVEERPKIAIVLGSGLGDFAEQLGSRTSLPAAEIPDYPHSTVEGHQGRVVFGRLRNVNLMVFQGRVHFYETGNLNTVLYPLRLASKLGVKILIVTNAAGGVKRTFAPGDLMLIEDQINLTMEHPLVDKMLTRRPSTELYDPGLRALIAGVAERWSIKLRKGVYCGVKGPSYETAAEVEMIHRLGGDAVGMSTVQEVSLAGRLGMKVAGISCITNLATGILKQKLSHQEVTEVAHLVKEKFSKLLTETVAALR